MTACNALFFLANKGAPDEQTHLRHCNVTDAVSFIGQKGGPTGQICSREKFTVPWSSGRQKAGTLVPTSLQIKFNSSPFYSTIFWCDRKGWREDSFLFFFFQRKESSRLLAKWWGQPWNRLCRHDLRRPLFSTPLRHCERCSKKGARWTATTSSQ